MTKKKQEPRRHHVVSKFYLKGFGGGKRGEQLGAVSRTRLKQITLSVNDATVVSDFYRLENLENPVIFEDFLRKIEDLAAPVIRAVLLEDRWPLNVDDRVSLAQFITLQYLRGKSVRDYISNFGQAFVDSHIESCPGAERDRILSIVAGPATHVGMIAVNFEQYLGTIVRAPWQLVQFSEHKLLTSDAPVTLVPPLTVESCADVGMGTALCYLMPLSRRVGIVMKNIPYAPEFGMHGLLDGRRIEPTEDLAILFNNATAGSSNEWLFSHPEDVHIFPKSFPSPQRPAFIDPKVANVILDS